MTISYPLMLPSAPAAQSFRLSIIRAQSVLASINGRQQIQRRPGDHWEGVMTMPPINDAQKAEWEGTLTALNGMVGTFTLPHPSPAMRGSAAHGVGVVQGGGQLGSMLATAGWPISTAGLFKRGDIIQVGNRLKIVLADAGSNLSGVVSLHVAPEIFAPPSDLTPIGILAPAGEFRLKEPKVDIQSNANGTHSLSFAVTEVML